MNALLKPGLVSITFRKLSPERIVALVAEATADSFMSRAKPFKAAYVWRPDVD